MAPLIPADPDQLYQSIFTMISAVSSELESIRTDVRALTTNVGSIKNITTHTAEVASTAWAIYKANFIPATTTAIFIVGLFTILVWITPSAIRWFKGKTPDDPRLASIHLLKLDEKLDLLEILERGNAEIKAQNDILIASHRTQTLFKISENPTHSTVPQSPYLLYDDLTEECLLRLEVKKSANALLAWTKSEGIKGSAVEGKAMQIIQIVQDVMKMFTGTGVPDRTLEDIIQMDHGEIPLGMSGKAVTF